MTVLIGSWEFEGPFVDTTQLRKEPGICAVLTAVDGEYELVEMEESESVRTFFEQHKNYILNGEGETAAVVYYCEDLTSALRQGLIDEVMKELESLSEDALPAAS